MDEARVLLVGADDVLLRAWSWELTTSGAWVGLAQRSGLRDRLASLPRTLDAVVVDACGDLDGVARDVGLLRAHGPFARLIVATRSPDEVTLPETFCLAPPFDASRVVAAVQQRGNTNRRRPVHLELDTALDAVLRCSDRLLSRQMRIVAVMCELGLTYKEMSMVLEVSEKTVYGHVDSVRDRLGWRSRNDGLRHVARAMGWELRRLLTRLLDDEDLATRIAAIVEPVPRDFTGEKSRGEN